MTRSICHPFLVRKRFPNLQPLQSPDSTLTAELSTVGYWAAQEEGRFYLVIGYHPAESVSDRINAVIGHVLIPPKMYSEGGMDVEIEEYEVRDEWRRRVLQLISPDGGTDIVGVGARLRPTPPAPAFPYADPWPEGA